MPLRRSRYPWVPSDASRMKTETDVPVGSGRPFRHLFIPTAIELQRQRRWHRLAGEYRLATLDLAGFREVVPAIETPEGHHAESDVRLLDAHATDGERADQVKQHASQVRDQSKQRNEHVLEAIEGMMLFEGHHRDEAGDH